MSKFQQAIERIAAAIKPETKEKLMTAAANVMRAYGHCIDESADAIAEALPDIAKAVAKELTKNAAPMAQAIEQMGAELSSVYAQAADVLEKKEAE